LSATLEKPTFLTLTCCLGLGVRLKITATAASKKPAPTITDSHSGIFVSVMNILSLMPRSLSPNTSGILSLLNDSDSWSHLGKILICCGVCW